EHLVTMSQLPQGAIDLAFKSIPLNKPYFAVWRIEEMKVVAVPKPQWGNFYRGDAYIVYSCLEIKGRLEQHVHFWLGSGCSQDESTVAAFKTVELDDLCGGAPVQHREVEGNESLAFLAYFKKGIKYNEGGVKSGLSHVDRDSHEPKLYQVKGKRSPRCRQVPMEWSSFNSGDVFINDQGRLIFVWNGSQSSRRERLKAMEVARSLRDERSSAELLVLEEGEESTLEGEQKEAFESSGSLALSARQIAPASAAASDEEFERTTALSIRLFRCSDEGGTLRVMEISSGPLHHNMLDTKDVFIIDNANHGVWIWCGRLSSKNEKRAAMTNALSFVEKLGKHASRVQVTRVNEGCETTQFKQLFQTWPAPQYSGKVAGGNRIAKTVQTQFDASTMHQSPKLAAQTRMVDDGSGKVQIWRIENMELVPQDRVLYGQFYGGDSYVIQYTYSVKEAGGERYIVYFWQGRKSSQDERGASALHATALDDQLGGAAVQVRIVQGKEPQHFLALFKGRMIVFDGGKAGWSKDEKDQAVGDTYLLRIRGTNALNTKAEQVPTESGSLNSNDTFVLVSRQAIFIWCGKGTTGDEREVAKDIAKTISRRDYVLLCEGQETEVFWQLLGGRGPYQSDKRLQEANMAFEPRLFQCSNAKGYFTAEEISNFTQDDLVEEDVMLLDTGDEVYIWIGVDSNEAERQAALQAAVDYLKSDPTQSRDPDSAPIYRVKQGHEPPVFIGFFPSWDYQMWSGAKSYEQMKQEFQDSSRQLDRVDLASESLNGSGGGVSLSFGEYKKIPYQTLRQKCPDSVRPDEKELHLTEEEFHKVFGMSYPDFANLPEWKKTNAKKAVGLF
ncbi:hypothetical protein BOX15_Mlig017793g1, partial [Macrostomum lignano]